MTRPAPPVLAPAAWQDNPTLLAPPHQLQLDAPLELDCGATLPAPIVNFETYGTLSPSRDNAVLVCHSLTHRAHAAGRRATRDPRPGWWDGAIGPGKLLDTTKYFVICTDALGAGGRTGPSSTGPATIDPDTGRPYGMRFPVITVRDMVNLQHQLTERLGLEQLHAVIGGCLGGQQAIEWAICYPDQVRNAVVITTTPATSAHTIAIFAVMRHLIRADPQWRGGDYYETPFPSAGLNAAVAAAVPLWMSREAMDQRFGRKPASHQGHQGQQDRQYTMAPEFAVEAFIETLVAQARHELDPNSLMYLTRAVDYFDLEHEYGGLDQALEPVQARVLFVSYRDDWRYPAAETERMHRALTQAGGHSTHSVLDSHLGHGAFLFDVPGLAPAVTGFLDQARA